MGKVGKDASASTAAGRWTRRCPVCGRPLGKEDPMDRISCECGWEWG